MSKLDSMSRRQFLGAFGAATVAMAGLGLVGCGGNSASTDAASSASDAASVSGTVNCSGATSFQTLVESAAHKFEDKYPDVTIAITGGGSGQGLSDVKDGKAQVGRSDVFAEEKLDAADAEKLEDHTVCVVGMGPVVNSSVDVDDLTTEQLKGIFTGAITDWSEVGGTAGASRSSSARPARHPRHLRGRRPGRREGPRVLCPRRRGGLLRHRRREDPTDRGCHLLPGLLLLRRHQVPRPEGRRRRAHRRERLLRQVQHLGLRAHVHRQGRRRRHQGLPGLHDVRRRPGQPGREEGFIPASDMKVAKDAKGNVSSK